MYVHVKMGIITVYNVYVNGLNNRLRIKAVEISETIIMKICYKKKKNQFSAKIVKRRLLNMF